MVLTNKKELGDRLARLRSHGITRDPASMVGEPDGPWYYQQIELGYNYRMTDIQAALGTGQMQRLDEFVARRHALAKRYDEALRAMPVTLPWQDPDSFSAYHLYVIRLDHTHMMKPHRTVFEELRQQGIMVNLHYIPVHTQPYYRRMGFTRGDFPESERYYAEAISLPLYYGLTVQDQDRVIEALRKTIA